MNEEVTAIHIVQCGKRAKHQCMLISSTLQRSLPPLNISTTSHHQPNIITQQATLNVEPPAEPLAGEDRRLQARAGKSRHDPLKREFLPFQRHQSTSLAHHTMHRSSKPISAESETSFPDRTTAYSPSSFAVSIQPAVAHSFNTLTDRQWIPTSPPPPTPAKRRAPTKPARWTGCAPPWRPASAKRPTSLALRTPTARCIRRRGRQRPTRTGRQDRPCRSWGWGPRRTRPRLEGRLSRKAASRTGNWMRWRRERGLFRKQNVEWLADTEIYSQLGGARELEVRWPERMMHGREAALCG